MTTTATPVPLPQLLEQASWAHRLARSLVHDTDEADDLVQETWIAALRRPPAADRPLRPWLATVLRRQRTKRAIGEERRGAREEVATAAADEVPSPETLLGRVEAQRLLASLVTALDEPYRQTILLRYYEGLTSAEIARRQKVPAATVRWRLKEGLDRLRATLDAGSEGGRERWLGLLAPLAPTPGEARANADAGWGGGRVVSRAGRVVLVLGVAGLLPLGAWVAVRGRGAGGLVAADRGEPATPGAEGGGPAAPLAAAVTASGPQCRKTVERLREQVAATETQAMAHMRGPKLFTRGTPNPGAEKELAAPLARIMALGGRAPSYTLECRTWVCKMTVAKTPEEAARTNEWQLPLQRDPEMSARVNGRGFHGGGQVKDPLSGVVMTTQDVYLTLRDPSGKARSDRHPTVPKPNLAFGPIPTDPAGCKREIDNLRERLAVAQADVEADLPLDTRFARSAPNPTLTAETTALSRRIFGTEAGAPTAECRGQVCKLTGPEPMARWRQRLDADPEFRLRREGGMCCTEILYMMKTPEQLAATRWLHRLADAFVTGPAPAACAQKHAAAEGMLNLELELPATGQPNAEGVTGRLALRLGGPLMGSPLAACLADEAAHTLLTTAVPQPTAAAKAYRRLKYPLAPSR
jgi:RNA polymerase sigma-70 factor (ECF subfamily)